MISNNTLTAGFGFPVCGIFGWRTSMTDIKLMCILDGCVRAHTVTMARSKIGPGTSRSHPTSRSCHGCEASELPIQASSFRGRMAGWSRTISTSSRSRLHQSGLFSSKQLRPVPRVEPLARPLLDPLRVSRPSSVQSCPWTMRILSSISVAFVLILPIAGVHAQLRGTTSSAPSLSTPGVSPCLINCFSKALAEANISGCASLDG